MPGALAGIRVVELGHLMQAPWAAQILGDMGAEVVKIERPGTGDRARRVGVARAGGESAFFLAMNRNKKGLAVDIKDPRGLEIVRRLLRTADVFIENFRPGALDRAGLGHEAVSALNPRLVYASGTGFGRSGPRAGAPGQDLLIQSLTGLASITGRPPDPPTPLGSPVVDQHSATLLALGIVLALFHRERSGRGQRVEVNLFSSALDLQPQEISTYLNGGIEPVRGRSAGHVYIEEPHGIYRARDGFLAIALAPLLELGEALGCPELAERYATPASRLERRDEVAALIEQALAGSTVDDWVERLGARGIWCAPVQGYERALTDPQARASGMIRRVDHPTAGEIRVTGIPIAMSETPGDVGLPPPLLGQHTGELLREIGYDDEAISALRRDGVI